MGFLSSFAIFILLLVMWAAITRRKGTRRLILARNRNSRRSFGVRVPRWTRRPFLPALRLSLGLR